MNYTEFFYDNYAGTYDLTENNLRQRTQATIEYLIDNGVGEQDILKTLIDCTGKTVIDKSDLPAFLWKGSLIKRDKYYYHHVLQIIPDVGSFYIEIKIRFTLNDLFRYFVRILNVDTLLINTKQYLAQLNSLLERYSHLKFIESLDFVLALIDNAARKNYKVIEPFDLNSSDNVSETFNFLKSKVAEAVVRDSAKEIFRKAAIKN